MFHRSFNVWPISCCVSFFFFDEVFLRILRLAVFRHELRRLHVLRLPVKIINLIDRAQMILRMRDGTPDTTPCCAACRAAPPPSHSPARGSLAADAAIHVRRVIVENVVRRAMNLHPLDRLARLPARAHRLELRVILLHLLVAGHAGLRVRQIRMRRHVDEAVAITAIHPELLHVNVVRERHRLDRLVADARVFRRRRNTTSRRSAPVTTRHRADENLERKPVRPAWKKVRHTGLANRCVTRSQPTTYKRERDAERMCCARELFENYKSNSAKPQWRPLYEPHIAMAKENSFTLLNSVAKSLRDLDATAEHRATSITSNCAKSVKRNTRCFLHVRSRFSAPRATKQLRERLKRSANPKPHASAIMDRDAADSRARDRADSGGAALLPPALVHLLSAAVTPTDTSGCCRPAH